MKSNNKHCLDLIGQRFGRLVVVDRADDWISETTGKHKTQWVCNCDCGNKGKIIRGSSLVSGKIQSCGCLRKEIASITAKTKISHGKKYNNYDLSGPYGIGYTFKNEKFFFDLEDYEKIKDICWWKTDSGYIKGYDIKKHKIISMHQLIMNEDSINNYVVDHIYSNYKHDNRKCNLRLVTQKDNAKNRKTPNNNTSGTIGVSWHKGNNKWIAYIKNNGETQFLGYYENKNDAIIAREKAEQELWGDLVYKPGNKGLRFIDIEESKKFRFSSFYLSSITLSLANKEEVDNFVC